MFTSFTQYDTNRQTETETVKSMRELGGVGGGGGGKYQSPIKNGFDFIY